MADPRSSRFRSAGIQAQLVAMVVLVVLPMAVIGAWLAFSARRSAEALLRERLDAALGDMTRSIGEEWVALRSELLTLGEEAARAENGDAGAGAEMRRHWLSLDGVATRAVLRSATGGDSLVLGRDASAEAPAAGSLPVLPVDLDIYAPGASRRVATLRVWLRTSALYPGGLEWQGAAGSVLALFDTNGRPLIRPTMIPPTRFLQDRFSWEGGSWFVVHRGLSEPPLRLAVAAPLAPIAQPFRQAARRGTIALLLVLAGAVGVGLLLARRTARPLVDLATAAGSVAGGDLERRVAERGPREVQRLAGAFNDMASSLRRTLQQLSRREAAAAVGEFAASIAHEVRNPLTSLQLDLQRSLRRLDADAPGRELVDRALEQARRLDRSVQGALELARSGRLELRALDLAEPLGRAVELSRPVFDEQGARLHVEHAGEPVTVAGNVDALERLFLNLLVNAAAAAGQGGSVRLRWARIDGGAEVIVEDDGPGIPVEQRERVLEPFHSGRDGGTGLGLPVAARIAKAHGGSLAIGESQAGGAALRVVLPQTGTA